MQPPMTATMRKLRLAIVSAGSLTHVGPYLEYLTSRGHEVHWVTYDRPSRDYGATVHDLSRGANSKQQNTKWKYLLAGLSARRLLRRIKPDLVHGHYVTGSGVVIWLSGYRPFVLTAHGSDLIASTKSRLWRGVLRKVLPRAAWINVVSDELADLARGLGVRDDRLIVANVGVDVQRFAFRPGGAIRRPPRLLCTRTLDDVYDPATIIEACRLLRAEGVAFSLTFAAGGPLENPLRQQVAASGLDEQVRFLGGYVNNTLPAILAEHDVYISASLWDGTSICLLEAMAAGLFPIVSRIRSNLAWVDEGKTALTFTCRDAQQLAQAIKQALADTELRSRAVEINRATVEQRGDRAAIMSMLENRYYSWVEERASSPGR